MANQEPLFSFFVLLFLQNKRNDHLPDHVTRRYHLRARADRVLGLLCACGQPKHLQARALAHLGSLHVEQCANRAAGRSQRLNYCQRELLGTGTGGGKEQMQILSRGWSDSKKTRECVVCTHVYASFRNKTPSVQATFSSTRLSSSSFPARTGSPENLEWRFCFSGSRK